MCLLRLAANPSIQGIRAITELSILIQILIVLIMIHEPHQTFKTYLHCTPVSSHDQPEMDAVMGKSGSEYFISQTNMKSSISPENILSPHLIGWG